MCSYIQVFTFLCTLLQPITAPQQWIYTRFADESTARHAIYTLYTLMETTYADIVQREQEHSFIRYTYENTPHYEMGYVFGEIIERYKRMVEQFKRVHSFKNRHMYDYMDAVEMMQKLYMEIYHLVAIMHEIPQKYKHNHEYKDLTMSDEEREQLLIAQQAFFAAAEQQKKESKKALKKELKEKEMVEAGIKAKQQNNLGGEGGLKFAVDFNLTDPKTAGQGAGPFGHSWAFPPKGKPFPLDYGWDILNW